MRLSPALGKRLRGISRTPLDRSGKRKAAIMRLTGECGELISRSVREARQLAREIRRRVRGRGAQAKLRAAAKLTEPAEEDPRSIDEGLTVRLKQEFSDAERVDFGCLIAMCIGFDSLFPTWG